MNCLNSLVKKISVVLFLLSPIVVSAQIVSLTSGEIFKLKQHNQINPFAEQLAASFKAIADQSLQEQPNPIAKIDAHFCR